MDSDHEKRVEAIIGRIHDGLLTLRHDWMIPHGLLSPGDEAARTKVLDALQCLARMARPAAVQVPEDVKQIVAEVAGDRGCWTEMTVILADFVESLADGASEPAGESKHVSPSPYESASTVGDWSAGESKPTAPAGLVERAVGLTGLTLSDDDDVSRFRAECVLLVQDLAKAEPVTASITLESHNAQMVQAKVTIDGLRYELAKVPASSALLEAATAVVEASEEEVTEEEFSELMGDLKAAIGAEGNRGWPELMDLLDEHWPTSIFPALKYDDEARDSGPRIVSLLRWVDGLKDELAEARTRCARTQTKLEHHAARADKAEASLSEAASIGAAIGAEASGDAKLRALRSWVNGLIDSGIGTPGGDLYGATEDARQGVLDEIDRILAEDAKPELERDDGPLLTMEKKHMIGHGCTTDIRDAVVELCRRELARGEQ